MKHQIYWKASERQVRGMGRKVIAALLILLCAGFLRHDDAAAEARGRGGQPAPARAVRQAEEHAVHVQPAPDVHASAAVQGKQSDDDGEAKGSHAAEPEPKEEAESRRENGEAKGSHAAEPEPKEDVAAKPEPVSVPPPAAKEYQKPVISAEPQEITEKEQIPAQKTPPALPKQDAFVPVYRAPAQDVKPAQMPVSAKQDSTVTQRKPSPPKAVLTKLGREAMRELETAADGREERRIAMSRYRRYFIRIALNGPEQSVSQLNRCYEEQLKQDGLDIVEITTDLPMTTQLCDMVMKQPTFDLAAVRGAGWDGDYLLITQVVQNVVFDPNVPEEAGDAAVTAEGNPETDALPVPSLPGMVKPIVKIPVQPVRKPRQVQENVFLRLYDLRDGELLHKDFLSGDTFPEDNNLGLRRELETNFRLLVERLGDRIRDRG